MTPGPAVNGAPAVATPPGAHWISSGASFSIGSPGRLLGPVPVENVRILPVFGAGALQASPRIGYLHITVDDLPWWWADASDNNTIDIAGLPPGQHKVKIELVDANHNVFPGQVVMLTFIVPDHDKMSHSHAHGGGGRH
jgi:Family of unknown function (DUF6130)